MITSLKDETWGILERMKDQKKLTDINAVIEDLIERSKEIDERDELRRKLKEYEDFELAMREAIQSVWADSPVAKQFYIDTGEKL